MANILCQVVLYNVKISHGFCHNVFNFAGLVIKALDSHIVAGERAGKGWTILVFYANNIYIFSKNAKFAEVIKTKPKIAPFSQHGN